MATIKDVAAAANVSPAAASYALSGSNKVSEATRKKVKDAAKKLGYHPSAAARSLKMRKTNTIGVFLPGFSGGVFSGVASAIHNTVAPLGYETIICSTELSEKLLLEKHVDGAIILNALISDKTIAKVQRPDYPIVTLERDLNLPYVSSVLADNEGGGYAAVRHLIDAGCKNIALMAGSEIGYENHMRMQGARRAFTEAGIDPETRPVVCGRFNEQQAVFATQSLLAAVPDVDGLFCFNDEMAIGAMRVIQQSGRSIPGDVSVVGYDDIELASYLQPALTTINADLQKWGQLAANSLYEMLVYGTPGKRVVFPVHLVARQSTKGYNVHTMGPRQADAAVPPIQM